MKFKRSTLSWKVERKNRNPKPSRSVSIAITSAHALIYLLKIMNNTITVIRRLFQWFHNNRHTWHLYIWNIPFEMGLIAGSRTPTYLSLGNIVHIDDVAPKGDAKGKRRTGTHQRTDKSRLRMQYIVCRFLSESMEYKIVLLFIYIALSPVPRSLVLLLVRLFFSFLISLR